MKKNIQGTAIIAAIVLAARRNINWSNNYIQLSDLALNNVEALLNREGGDRRIKLNQRMYQNDMPSLLLNFMKKYLISFLSFILIGFTACSGRQRQEDKSITFKRNDFKVQTALTSKTIEFDSILLRPSQIQLFDSFLVTCNQGAEKQFQIFNLNTKHKEGECIPMGQGPKEMMVPCFINRNDSVVLFDMMTSTILTYSIDGFISGNNPDFISRISLDTKPLWSNIRYLDNGFIGVSYQAVSPCYLFNREGVKTMDFGTYPQSEYSYTPAEIINAFRADLTTDLKDKIAVTHYFTDLICLYKADGTLEKELHGPDNFASIFKEFKDGDIIGSKADPRTYRDAFYSPVNVGNSIFVLYNGKRVEDANYNILCKELFVFGWDGSLECHYTLDQGVFSIAVDNQKRKIYGISDDPEYHIVVFDY